MTATVEAAPAAESSAGAPFVGRTRELQALERTYRDAAAGRGGLVLLLGPSGIGKTRTVEEFLARSGVPPERTLWGRCTEDTGAPAYWPWVQALRSYFDGRDREALRAETADLAGDIARLSPALRDRLGATPPATDLDPEQARFQLFDAVALFLSRTAARDPLVVVLDDVQVADEGSLHLLSFVAREARGSRLLVVATCRDSALRERPLLLDAIRSGDRIVLRGLEPGDVARLVRETARSPLPERLLDRLHRASDGNPFFIGEMLRAYESDAGAGAGTADADLSLPDEVRELLARHTAPLSDEDRRVLSMAATIGREFDLLTLQGACELPADRALDHVDAAARAGIVEDVPGRIGRYRFRHALLRDAQYAELGPAERAARHLAVARALEAQLEAGGEAPLDELAYHFHAAAPLGEADKAIAYSVRAARRALDQLAYEEAVKHFERARDASSFTAIEPAAQLRLLLGLADAIWQTGDHARARSLYERAARSARSLGDARLFGFAALGFDRSTPDDGAVHPDVIALLEEALAGLPERQGRLAALLLARVTVALYFTQDRPRLEELSREAIETARRTGVPRAVITALITRQFVLLGPNGSPTERLHLMNEALRIARESNDLQLAQPAHAWRVIALLEMGDPAARTELAQYCRRWEETRLPVAVWHARVLGATSALLDGRFLDAARLAATALAGRMLGPTSAPAQFFVLQMADVLREWGRFGELEAPLRAIVEAYPTVPGWRCVLAALLVEAGRHREARALVEPIAQRSFAALPRDGNFIASMSWLAEPLTALGEPAWTQAAYEALAPLADRNAIVLFGSVCRGSLSRDLGVLAASLGRLDDALRHLEKALAMNVRIGARVFAARTRLDLARIFATRGSSGDLERARDLAAEAASAASALELPRLAAGARSVLDAAEGGAGAAEIATDRREGRAAASAEAVAPVAVLRRDGDSWAVGYGGEEFRLADMKGLAHLARLVADPGRDVPALELVSGVAPPGDAARGSADAASERARVNATRAIAAAVKRIAQLCPALGRHLSASVHTGLVCSYRPDPDQPIAWRL